MPNAVQMLVEDHRKVQELFDQFEASEGRRTAERKKIVDKTLLSLLVHAELEEEIVYPAFRAVSDEETMNEADEEHHVAEVLIDELANMNPEDELHTSARNRLRKQRSKEERLVVGGAGFEPATSCV